MTWQTMDTAPKDGTRVWGWTDERGSNPMIFTVSWGWVITYDDTEIQPSFWMPLPDPPSEPEPKEYLSVDAEARAEAAGSYREGDLDKFFGCAPDAKYPEDADREIETEHRCVTCGLTIVAYRNVHLCAECEESRGR